MEARLSLPPRLRAVARAVLPNRPMADIGTDHARLPAWLVHSATVPRAIACDVAEGPLAHARRTLLAFPELAIELRAGSGLSPISPGEVGTCVLAGMGGALMRELVDASPTVTASLDRLVLQPNTDWPSTRAWIAAHAWTLVDEQIVQDRRHHYLVLVVDPRTPASPNWSTDDLELGPLLRHRRDESWHAWLHARIRHEERALARARAALPDCDPRVRALASALDRLRARVS